MGDKISLEHDAKSQVLAPRDGGVGAAELSSLRLELGARIMLQNGLLFLAVVLFVPIAAIACVLPQDAWRVAFVHGCTIMALALQWCHHGVRTKQIKAYLLSKHAAPEGWELWLPANRPASLLGSRWMVSTKGVFLGLGMSSMLLAIMLKCPPAILPVTVTMIVWLLTAILLFTNPKE